MEALPYFISFAVVCFFFSFGLYYRRPWMWYSGWVVFYLFASKFGTFFFDGLFYATNNTQVVYACIYLAGGLVLWMPAAIWWATHSHAFGIRPGRNRQVNEAPTSKA